MKHACEVLVQRTSKVKILSWASHCVFFEPFLVNFSNSADLSSTSSLERKLIRWSVLT